MDATSISLLYASMEATVARGMLLLGASGLGLGVPFLVAAIGFNWFLTSLEALRNWARPIQRIAGILLLVIGVPLVTGRCAAVSAALADLGR